MTDVIDTLAVAQAVLSGRRRLGRVSEVEIRAMSTALVRIAAADEETTPAIEPVPSCSASLAAAIARAIKAFDHRAEVQENWAEEGAITKLEADIALDEAFKALKTLFESEFPNV